MIQDSPFTPKPPAAPPVRLLLTKRQAAAALGVCEKTIDNYALPRVTIGRAVRYDLDDLRAWINARKAGGMREGGADGG